jgi:hypothetical protein
LERRDLSLAFGQVDVLLGFAFPCFGSLLSFQSFESFLLVDLNPEQCFAQGLL